MRQIVISVYLTLLVAAGVSRAGQVEVPVLLTEEQSMASAISRPVPAYAKAALQLKMEGRVGLNLSVNKEGLLYDHGHIVRQSVLTQMAVEGVKQWKFMPFPDQGGRQVKAMFPVTIDLHLTKSSKS
jgi:outer membrane biosynthesis protein TonB